MKRHMIIGMLAMAGMATIGGCAVVDTVTADPVKGPADAAETYRAETIGEALAACGELSSEAEEVRACRDQAYSVSWRDWAPICEEEDDSTAGCVWVAPDRGNLEGDSFVVTMGGSREYVDHETARAYLTTYNGLER